RIDFDSTPFYVNAALNDWPDVPGAPRRAGVSAFGVGGTNVHVVLEAEPQPLARDASDGPHLLTLSARSDAAVADAATRLASHLRAGGVANVADVAVTLQHGRRAFSRRRALVAGSLPEAIGKLDELATQGGRTERAAVGEPAVAFLFPGQGAQYVGMGRELYATNAVFRDTVDQCAEIVRPLLGVDILTLLYPEQEDDAATRALTATSVAQPAIFTVSYALAKVWASWGVSPAVTIGHSVGEFVAATLASVFSLADALRLVTERGRLMQNTASGSMLAVRLAESELVPLLSSGLGIAAVNAPLQTVVAGPHDEIDALQAALAQHDVTCKRIATSHAFHSPMMDAIQAPLERLVATMQLSAPAEPYVSTVTGRPIEEGDALSPAYWASHARATVRFADAVATLADAGITAFLEVGPGTALGSAVRQTLGREADCAIVASLPDAQSGGELASLLEAAGRLWETGVQLDLGAVDPANGRRISLPAYPFERRSYWLDAPNAATPPLETTDVPTDSAPDATQRELASDATQRELATLLEELSGERVEASQADTSFLELGFDSLFLGRFVQKLNARFGSAVTFRQLLGDVPTSARSPASSRRLSLPPHHRPPPYRRLAQHRSPPRRRTHPRPRVPPTKRSCAISLRRCSNSCA
ncbi:MAG: acyltransferase domain-containing protein, partial [Candidatus Eremiobacteraeota bacterium]|nr:acyltransferase domain-containing protein [Candidatus Eremiobacteraeota bacterium]